MVQLQDYYDQMKERLENSARVDEGGPGLLVLRNQQRRARRELEGVPQPVPQAGNVTYPQEGPHPVGAPMPVNPQLLAGGLINRPPDDRNPAPWTIARAIPEAETPPDPLEGWNVRRWCQTCGWRKNQHGHGERFGLRCSKDYCGKCYQRKEFHENGKMGPYCTKEPNERGASDKWYE